MSFSLRPPEPIDLHNLDIKYFVLWVEAFEDYACLAKPSISDEDKLKLFLTVAGLPVRSLLSSLPPVTKKYDECIEKLKKHIEPVKCVILERHKFFTSKQLSSETVSDYLVRLSDLSKTCNFDDSSVDSITNQLIRDQFVTGVTDVKIAEALLREGDISLQDATKKSIAIEQASKDLNLLANSSNQKLFVLGSSNEKRVSGKSCFNCGLVGHFANVCPNSKVSKDNISH